MILQDENSGVLDNSTFEVLGTDADEQAVNFARRGLYDPQSTRPVNPHFREAYFVAAGDQVKINLQIKARVSFKLVDLFNDAQMTFIKGMDAIFCCNVLAHLDRPKKQRVLQHFWAALQPHGYLFLGESESLYGISQDFERLDLRSNGVYQKIPQRIL
jgi:chemotaxis protein methyltransferase CheR